MYHSSTYRLAACFSAFVAAGLILTGCRQGKPVDFSAEVKPILNKHCISCHGGVKQSGGFSVLFREEALGKTKSGKPAIIPGDPDHSEFIRRLHSKDPKERMPYKTSPLSKEEIGILTRWVKQGAQWGEHWAYVAPAKPALEEEQLSAGPNYNRKHKSGIDYFITRQLDAEKLTPAPEADRQTLLRRVCLDLTGLPPTEHMMQSFLADNDPRAYEKIVDSLLASSQYGERWASMWLDLARYSDTKGYEKDTRRQIWRYRDWVIDAFNQDMPFDQFTIEQLAGDLLPDPTDAQRIATAFHRNTMTNDEGGTQDEEFRTAAIIDRVNTTMETWQGTTIACVQCHSHPYDPFRFEDYYKLMAFLNNTRDEDSFGDHPVLRFYDSMDSRKVQEVTAWVKQYAGDDAVKQTKTFLRMYEPKIHAHDCDTYTGGELADTKWAAVSDGGSFRLHNVPINGRTHLVMAGFTTREGGTLEVRLDSLKGPIIARHTFPKGNQLNIVSLPAIPGRATLYFVLRNPGIPKVEPVTYIEWFAFADLPGRGAPGYAAMERTFWQLVNANTESIPVVMENPAEMTRSTHVFERGNWLVKGAAVKADVPHSLNPFPANAPRNRLGLAQWLVSKENPLTARVMVNRLWEQLFGIGIVETLEDFGTQGFLPSNQALLDYLAYEFMNRHQWHIKPLLKDMVMSDAYRRDSKSTPELHEKDPANRYLARGPRFRLSAEQIRDQALAVSGLLHHKMHGQPVMPYQPDGIWQSVYNGEQWKQSENGDQHRRAVYTFLKRTSPYPSMLTFDGSSREVCLQRRIRTNTPLQALTTLNDPVYVEAARHLAVSMKKKGGADRQACIKAGYNAAMLKTITPAKLQALEKLYEQAFVKYKKDPKAVSSLLQGGTDSHLAALTVVANAILNLDEFLTKS